MQQFRIRFSSFADVQGFVNLATCQDFPIIVGDDTYRVSGSSFMGMFTLDHSKPLFATLDCSDEEAENFRRTAARYIFE